MQTRAEHNSDRSKRIRDLQEIETKLLNYKRLTEGLSMRNWVRLDKAQRLVEIVKEEM